MTTARIAIIQVQMGWPELATAEEKERANVAEFTRLVDAAGEQRADLVLAGECINRCGIARSSSVEDDLYAGPFFQAAQTAARRHRCYVVYSVKGRDEAGVLRNAALVIGRGGEHLGTYCKVHLTRVESDAGVVPGNEFPVFETDIGPVGILICHDLSYPESARCLMLNGARLLLWPSNWVGWGEQISYAVIASRAIDNSVHLAYASQGYPPREVNWNGGTRGRSALFDPEGRIVAQITDRLPGLLVQSVDLARKRIAPGFTLGSDDVFLDSILRERRPEAYGPIVRRAAQQGES